VNGKSLLDALAALLARFVILPPRAADALALWILHTYVCEHRDICTYIGIESPLKRCGKTTLLSLLGELVHRPVAASNVSPPAFFRVIQDLHPTLLIDEADTFLASNEQLRGILNSGYHKKNSYVLRALNQSSSSSSSDSDSAWPAAPKSDVGGASPSQSASASASDSRSTSLPSVASFSCWGPKVIATIGHFPDTLADRCIVIRMQRKAVREQCERLRNIQPEPLRQQCARFAADNGPAIAAANPESVDELNDRAADIWEPLFVLADLAGGDWPQRARQAALTLSAAATESNPLGSLLLDIWTIMFQAPDGRMFTRDLVARLNYITGHPWTDARQNKPISDLWLATQLRPYGVKPRTIWIGDDHAKGYDATDLEDTFKRYVSRADLEALKAEWAAEKRPANNNNHGAPPQANAA
jgi:putative DNA primase/helicase